MSTPQVNTSSCYSLHGNLFLPFQMQKVFAGTNTYQDPNSYEIPEGVTLKEECSRGFNIARAEWEIFNRQVQRQDITESQRLEFTTHFVKRLLSFSLGYKLEEVDPIFVQYIPDMKSPEDRFFPVTLLASKLPVAIVDAGHKIDERHPVVTYTNKETKTKTAFQIIQELLNGVTDYVWGFVSNGQIIRLVHKATSLTIPCYVEFNLEEMFSTANYAEFFNMWQLLHASRATIKNKQGENVWDQWVTEGFASGQPAREALSANLEEALQILGEGFLNTPGNDALLARLQANTAPNGSFDFKDNPAPSLLPLSSQDYKHQLLQLVYRFLFVFCLEERRILNTFIADSPENELARKRYLDGYAFHRFIYSSRRLRFQNEHHDAWESVVIVFKSLNQGEPRLALPALGGLFRDEVCEAFMSAKLTNDYFFKAMEKMRWAVINGALSIIDYKNMDTEELGSIYEGLLELIPNLDLTRKSFVFTNALGNERKSTGSYYTPDFLVQSLIKSALVPVIKRKLEEQPLNPEQALLSIKVIDPACGSGHFLLGAARRIAAELAEIRAGNDITTPELYRAAMHDVVKNCIYGVDINPMAIELSKIALWIEGFAENTPLSFLDHHIKVGNALLGVFDVEMVKLGIPDEAYDVTDKDIEAEFNLTQKEVCKRLKAFNKQARASSANEGSSHQLPLFVNTDRKELLSFSHVDNEQQKEELYHKYLQSIEEDPEKIACDLYMAAFLSSKTEASEPLVPTSKTIFKQLYSPDQIMEGDLASMAHASKVCKESLVFHWPFEFPEAFNAESGDQGFDCVLGNPPWEKPKVEDEKWFADKDETIVNAQTAAKRSKMIKALATGSLIEQELYKQYALAKHTAGAFSAFGHLKAKNGGRFPLTGVGDTNLYAYFSELATQLHNDLGTVGIIVPLGILTDKNNQAFGIELFNGNIKSAYNFVNTNGIFKDVFRACSFVLLTLQKSDQADFVFYATSMQDLDVAESHVHFQPGDLQLLNPNTESCVPVRTDADLQLCRKIYQKAPVLVLLKGEEKISPWQINNMRMFDMANDSGLFHTIKDSDGLVPLYEGKYFNQFDHRWSTFDSSYDKNEHVRDVTQQEKEQSDFLVQPRYWIESAQVAKKLTDKAWTQPWVLAWRDIARATDERTLIAAVAPSAYGFGDSAPLLFPKVSSNLAACLLSMLNSMVVDFALRMKQSNAHVKLFNIQQLPILPPEAFDSHDVEFICIRVAKLTRTADDINEVWLTEYPAYTFQTPVERLTIRAELDAFIARKYGLSRDELRYILDPEDVKGKDFPSETFPKLKNKQVAVFGEYLTQRLVLEAFDALEAGTLKE